MKNITEEKALQNFRLCIFGWVLLANILFHYTNIEISWVVFVANALLFTFPGNLRKKFLSTVCGAAAGLVMSALLILAIVCLKPVLGDFLSFVIPLAAALFVIIVLQPKAPIILNTASFVYLTCACIESEKYILNLPRYLLVYLLGCVLFNAGSVLLLRFCFRNVEPSEQTSEV